MPAAGVGDAVYRASAPDVPACGRVAVSRAASLCATIAADVDATDPLMAGVARAARGPTGTFRRARHCVVIADGGPPVSRMSSRWRPFAPGQQSLDSQRYAIRAILSVFDCLVDVKLAGNPWRTVRDPKPLQRATRLPLNRASPAALWTSVRAGCDDRCRQDRCVVLARSACCCC